MYIKNYFGTLFKQSGTTNTFGEIFPTFSDFYTAYSNNPLPRMLDDNEINIVYYLLYGKYKNSRIKGDDEEQFKARVFTLIFQHGPEFSKKLEIRNKITDIDLTNDEWRIGGVQVDNTAANPETSPSTLTMEAVDHLDSQHATITKRGLLDGYAFLNSLVSEDVTQIFIDRFSELFCDIAVTSTILLYDVGEED